MNVPNVWNLPGSCLVHFLLEYVNKPAQHIWIFVVAYMISESVYL